MGKRVSRQTVVNSTIVVSGQRLLPTSDYLVSITQVENYWQLLCLADDIQAIDGKRTMAMYLVSVTTTSLYGNSDRKTGGLSQYDRLKHWKK